MNEYWTAIKDGDAERLRHILEASPDLVHSSVNSLPYSIEPDPAYHYPTTGAHVCSYAGRETLLSVLLDYKPNLEALTFEANKGLTTPLVIAAWEGSVQSCRLLLEAGANPNTSASAESPLYTAAEHHAWEKVALLVKYGAKHDIFTACICGDLDIARAEVEACRELLTRRSVKRHRTPLEEAAEHQQAAIVEYLKGLSQTKAGSTVGSTENKKENTAPSQNNSYDYQTSPLHMAMVLQYDANNVPQTCYEIRDDKLLKELEGFFPGYREFTQFESNEWEATTHRIFMGLHAGRTIKIISDGKRWGVTFGSAPLSGDLKSFLNKLPKNLVSLDEAVRTLKTMFPHRRSKPLRGDKWNEPGNVSDK